MIGCVFRGGQRFFVCEVCGVEFVLYRKAVHHLCEEHLKRFGV